MFVKSCVIILSVSSIAGDGFERAGHRLVRLTKNVTSSESRTSLARCSIHFRTVLLPGGGARCVPDHHFAAPSDWPLSAHTNLLACYVGAVGCDGRARRQQEDARADL